MIDQQGQDNLSFSILLRVVARHHLERGLPE
jgi:hypothetical protein